MINVEIATHVLLHLTAGCIIVNKSHSKNKHLSKIFVDAFQAGFSMEIIKEVDSVKCVQDINMLISYNVRTLGINN